ncbi:hypothetical protein [Parabacteroides sp. FAFU027]|uniref:hypothetical protein n=1 Tax=Parabacteroides sp. FAFU027 TaxID=2922715 RepID=UPI001FAFBF79|nr:hypothetical protein [Parabacteroides sp. FAFU027]
MKCLLKVFALFLGVCFLFVGCSDEPDSANSNQGGSLNNNVISGSIDSFQNKNINVTTVSCYGTGTDILGSGTISSLGRFSFPLTSPPENCLREIFDGGIFVGTISDTTALIGFYALQTFKSNQEIASYCLIRTNCNQINELRKVGVAYTCLVYSNKDVSIFGNHTITDEYADPQYSGKSVQYCSFRLKKGWNELVYKTTKRVITAYSHLEETSLTDTITSDLKWKLLSDINYQYGNAYNKNVNLIESIFLK